jgi:hypothetical protein
MDVVLFILVGSVAGWLAGVLVKGRSFMVWWGTSSSASKTLPDPGKRD